MDIHGPFVRAFRWLVFALAAFYAVRFMVVGPWDNAGGPFRFLTIWALFCSFFVASRLLAITERRSTLRWEGVVAMTTVLNAMVVFLYWRLFLADPTSVTRNGQLGVWWLEYYLHGLGPLLQWIDALFIHRGFRKPLAGAAWLVTICTAYLAIAELIWQPLNDSPAGSVTSGLPYPFLNSMDFDDRLVFYVTNVGLGLVLMTFLTGLAWVIRRWFQPSSDNSAARPAR